MDNYGAAPTKSSSTASRVTKHVLKNGDRVTIGASTLRFEQPPEERTGDLHYDDKPLGHTQLLISANDVMSTVLRSSKPDVGSPQDKMLETLQRKANILAALYEMSKTLGSSFDLTAIFAKATDIIFRSTPADRVVALLADGMDPGNPGEVQLTPIATRARDEKLEAHARKLTIGRTITRKVMKDRVALLSQDAASDEQFAGVDSIVSQGVRSTICAPLVTETSVHGALYADRLDPFGGFKPDDLELISAVAAQTAIAVENARAHERLAREEVARANYSRFSAGVCRQANARESGVVQTRRRQPDDHRAVCRHSRVHSHFRACASGKDRGAPQ